VHHYLLREQVTSYLLFDWEIIFVNNVRGTPDFCGSCFTALDEIRVKNMT
jgi:hypothetical protein